MEPPTHPRSAARPARSLRRLAWIVAITVIVVAGTVWTIRQHYRGPSSVKAIPTERDARRLLEAAEQARKVPAGLVAALPAYLTAAEAGSPAAMSVVAECYRKGIGTPIDAEKSLLWEKRAFERNLVLAQSGSAAGQEGAAQAYQDGVGVTKDEKVAAMWWERAAKSYQILAGDRDASAERRLAYLYLRGVGVPKDEDEADRLLRKAAAKGDPDAQVELGRRGGLVNVSQESIIWYRMAAEQGDADGQWSLAFMYEKGYGVPANPGEAFKWYTG